MTITAHSPKWTSSENKAINIAATFPWLREEVPFTATPDDSESHGRDLFARAVAGEFGEITPFVAPSLTLSDFQKAHNAFINAPAIARQYDSFVTFAMRAGYAGPYQAEAIIYANWMDTCNQLGYVILAEVQAGTRAMFATTAEYIALLPICPLDQ